MYRGVASIFGQYWSVYGGSKALLRSPYFHVSIVLLAITCRFWLVEKWWDQSLAVLPNLLGFSLAGFAMFLGVGDEKFRALLASKDEDENASPYLVLCSSFVHFILIQCLALLAAVIAKSLEFPTPFDNATASFINYISIPFRAAGYLLFLYAITSLLAATMSVFRICRIFERVQLSNGDKTGD
jgi:hypothetical protein